MEILIWLGAALTLLGVAGLGYCIWRALGLRKSALDDQAKGLALQRIVMINLAALGVSGIGLMLVVVGIFLR